jgi:alpha-glucosidase
VAVGDWWRYGVIYQIYPRSFADADGNGIGDLDGITEHLDHLAGHADSLGVDAIWLSPFYKSPMADYGYDVADYRDVDPMFGTLGQFDTLLAEAHRRGLKVIVDFVPNHTSDQHEWFIESRSSRDNPKRDWYVWADPKPDGSPPNNWRSSFAEVGPAWTMDETTGQYYLHSFMREQPDLNWWNPEVRDAMDDVLRFWLDRGVDGFRIDVAHRMAKDPELADNPLIEVDAELRGSDRREALLAASNGGEDLRDQDWPEVHEILRRFRRTISEYDDRMAVGEVYLLDMPKLVSYYGRGDELDLCHNFVFLHQPWKADAFRAVVEEFEGLLPEGTWPDYFLNNHDHSRVVTRYDDGGNGRARARVAAMMLLTLRGTPFLYQGEELGMRDGPVPPDRIVDVDGRDPERTPMHWDASPGAGFTTGEPWLPIDPEHERVNAAAQRGDATSMLSLYRRLLQLRRGSSALRQGAYASLTSAPDGVFAYLRTTSDEQLLVALNMTSDPVRFAATPQGAGGQLELPVSKPLSRAHRSRAARVSSGSIGPCSSRSSLRWATAWPTSGPGGMPSSRMISCPSMAGLARRVRSSSSASRAMRVSRSSMRADSRRARLGFRVVQSDRTRRLSSSSSGPTSWT